MTDSPPRVAVVGSGVAGLAACHALAGQARLTLFEAGRHFGGHVNTVDVTIDGTRHGVDTGFLVFNERTYPNLVQLLRQLGVAAAPSDMSFSVQVPARGFEWCGSDLNGVFVQRRNAWRPQFWRMLADLLRFNRLATRIATTGSTDEAATPLGAFLDQHRFSAPFRDDYLLPMIACIWSCPTDQMLRFPVATLIRFCHNHGLLQIADRPQWYTIPGGARRYVQRIVDRLPDARLATPVRRVRRVPPGSGWAGVWLDTDHGSERFDHVVLACHSDQALALLDHPTADERRLLGAIRFQSNRALLHTDASLLPGRRGAWAAWNYERSPDAGRERDAVCLHYLINKLQPLPWKTPVVVSLNPVRQPRADAVIAEIEYAHPIFDLAAIDAQRDLQRLQGASPVWFCGAWTGYGFHEDGLVSGLAVAAGVKASLGQRATADTHGAAA